MPHKFNTSRRHKFAKKKYRVTNWCGYNESLRNRGDLTVWITGDARKHWAAPRRRSRGGQPRYSDLAITMCLTLGMVYRLPLRQTQGLIRSISKLMLLEISVPDFSTLSRRGRGLSLPARPKIKITDPVHLAIDSTGLKVFDEGEWLQSKYNACLSGCHPHPLYVGCGVEWLGRRTKRGWMFRSAKTFRFRGRFPSFNDFSRMTRPVPPTWRRRGGVTGSSAPIARRRQSRSASPAGPASCAVESAAATPG